MEKAIATLKPAKIKTDPTTNFWTIYKKVADEHDNDLVSKYVGDLDTSLLFVSMFTSLACLIRLNQILLLCQAGLFSAVTSAFIIQIIPQLQPNPADLTNVLLLRILEQNASFGGIDPLAPILNVPTGVVKAQPILFVSLSVTLFVAFIAVLGKQWIHYYTRPTTWGNIVDRGKERQVKLAGLRKWGVLLIMESLPVMLQFALLLFGIAITVYLWDLDVSVAEVVLVVTSIGLTFYTSITAAGTIWSDFPFQTPPSLLLPKVLPWAKEFAAFARLWLRNRLRRRATALLFRIERVTENSYLASSFERVLRKITERMNASYDGYSMTLSNPAFWRHDPLFTSPVPKDVTISAGFWLLENSTDFSAAPAVAAIFSELQWPSHCHSTTALIRLRDAYVECFRAPEFGKSARLRALQSAAAYYVLYHTQLVWSTFNSREVVAGRLPPDLPPDLFLYIHNGEWDGDDVFEYLLHIEDRSEPGTSARFLSYIAPYWVCGDTNPTIRFRPSRLRTLYELIRVLKKSRALGAATLTECVLCIGAALDFPLHPEDLIRVDKRCVSLSHTSEVVLIGDSDYFELTFRMVVEYIHEVALTQGRRRRYAKTALEILLTLVEEITFPLVDAAWINELLKSTAGRDMEDDTFTMFLRLNARREEEDAVADVWVVPPGQDDVLVRGEADQRPPGGAVASETSTPEDTLFSSIAKNVEACIEKERGWQDEAVYGGFVAMRDNPPLGPYLPDGDVLQTLYNAMEKSKPFRIRKAAYDVILVTHDRWLKSAELRQTLVNLDFPRKLHSVVIETALANHRCSFLKMMETLSEERYWHSYLRKAMDIWLPFHHAGQDQVLRIFTNVGELPLPGYDGSNPPFDKFLQKFVEDEWAGVPGRHAQDLAADRLTPLAEVTKGFGELMFTDNDRNSVLLVVEQVIPSLERRRDDGYDGPGEDIRGIINDLLENLRTPMQSTGH